jgi:formyltetrahydrofolate deformylase
MPRPAGYVHAVTGLLVQQDCNIIDSQQFGAPSKKVFMRVHSAGTDVTDLKAAFQETAGAMNMKFDL